MSEADKETVSARMYRGILGDCFLLTHARGDNRFHALIDCGALQAIGDRPKTKAALGNLEAVVADLRATTNDHLDLVIVTHEHYDHLSGFMLHHEAFDAFTIGALWVAWTESRTDPLANDIRERGKKALSVLKAVVDQPAMGLDGEALARRQTIESLLQFYDDEIEPWTLDGGMGAAKKTSPRPYDPATQKPLSCANAITWLRFKAGETNVRYLEPGQVVRFGLNDRLTASVLGPPRGRDRLLQLDPSKGAGREVYLTNRDDIATLESILRTRSLGAAATPVPTAPGGAAANPFSKRFDRRREEHGESEVVTRYFAKGSESRRIDGEWLGAAETLALKIDGDVNNTSLALAIEIPGPARHVLLFPADAQVGNWLSWHDQAYPTKPGEASESAQEILSRVILYKVGHHGSHNATAREKGLEMMTSPHLTAMIPVVEEVAREQTTKTNADGWAMPYADLYARLKEKTRGRILKGDGDPGAEAPTFAGSIFELAYGDAGAWAELKLTVD